MKNIALDNEKTLMVQPKIIPQRTFCIFFVIIKVYCQNTRELYFVCNVIGLILVVGMRLVTEQSSQYMYISGSGIGTEMLNATGK